MDFNSRAQQKNYRRVLSGLRTLGYGEDLLVESYSFSDFLTPGQPTRVVPAAVFGRTPHSFDTACVSVLLPGDSTSEGLVNSHRAFGAPVAFVVDDDVVRQWKVGANSSKVWNEIPASDIASEFKKNAEDWSPDSILRAKNITAKLQSRQLDFVDVGLLPALEEHVRMKLDGLLKEVLTTATNTHKQQTRRKPNVQEMFRLVFRLLAAKVLSDRQVNGFRSIKNFDDVDDVLTRVGRHYKQSEPVISDPETRKAVADRLWNSLSFRNLSVESLAYVYEHTLIDDESRRKLGIHSTPVSVARYVAGQMLTDAEVSKPIQIVEPCSGHGIFLVAALERLRDLLPSGVNPDERHRYFVKSLTGFEKDAFALEISRLCLMLADFPFPNGWNLKPADVFDSKPFDRALTQADIVLCNPPYEPFSTNERDSYSNLISTQKPVELLTKVLDRLKPSGTLGFVLPRQVLDGKGYKGIREQLAKRFEEIDIVALPDRVFNVGQLETAILLAKSPRDEGKSVSVSFAAVRDADRERFLSDYAVSWRETEVKNLEAAGESLKVSPLAEIWTHLEGLSTIGDIASLRRGVQWQPPFEEDKYISNAERRGFRKGFYKVDESLMAFHPPETRYLSFRENDRLRNAFEFAWEKPKVFVNAATVSRGAWRLAAFADSEQHCSSQRFIALWPNGQFGPSALAAILNGPVANAFLACRENKLDNRKKTVQQIPVPKMTATQVQSLSMAVSAYEQLWIDESFTLDNASFNEMATRSLLEIDAILLRAYNLPPRLERQLLDFFRGFKRRVPFSFTEYFPANFGPHIPLWMYLTSDFASCNPSHLLDTIPKVKDPAIVAALTEVE
ncbi:class I SAM-dependent DNA methyltransferase [Rhodopirellula sp. SWK7]|uniref:HsdM family class I SAM-dependent methyltransferase n=1 Tax=Rhodopirellula sp. SWK7 TaxID=595460 RepID=UPI0002BF0288|nr:N-6 DNA methylase [Rhodopirellula sp. SWK7]EMI43649.1 N-6 DNA methylase [Rhodopirellula sp. SWK7]